jgi:4-carboxymuconolactone decarboxylase
MMVDPAGVAMLQALDDETTALVAAAAVVAVADEELLRQQLRDAAARVRPAWMEELILQSYLFAGFPRALNAMRIWRAVSGLPAPERDDEPSDDDATWSERGKRTCAAVYGPFYQPLRHNIAALHPALDDWMVTVGYGQVLGRPALDLARRELCVVAACVAAQQDRQLHSHLHGALHVGAASSAVEEALEVALASVGHLLAPGAPRRYRALWAKVLGRHPNFDS